MNEIFQIINGIILDKQEVELPAFGKFKGEVKQTEIHPVDNRFSPKYLKVSFVLNKNAKGDEIIKELSEKLEISQQHAEKKLDDFKKEVLLKLKKGEKVLFKELGYMYWKAGHLYFEQDLKYNYLKESFGLSSFNQELVKRERPQEPKKEIAQPKVKKSYKKLITGIAASIIVLAVAAAVYFNWDFVSKFYNDNFNNNITVENNDVIDTNIVEADTSTITVASKVDTMAENTDSNELAIDSSQIIEDIDTATEEVAEIDNKKEISKTEQKEDIVKQVEPSPEDRYYIIAGCFRGYNKATDFVKELNKKGYTAELRGKTNGLHRVIYSSHPNYSSALREMKEIINKEGRGPWIQKIK